MKAVVWKKYGSPKGLVYQEVEKPLPKDNEILIKLKTTTVTAGDCELRALKFSLPLKVMMRVFFGFFRPRKIILGQEYAGVVESIGKDVTSFKIGDEVFGATDLKFGAYAEYIAVKEDSVVTHKPSNMSFEEATGIPVGGLEALHFLTTSNVTKNCKLLINGAGGSIGTAAVQIAKDLGAEVTVVDHIDKLPMLKFIGADHVIDYKNEKFTKNKQKYDVIFDIVGKCSFYKTCRSLDEAGRYIIANPKGLDKLRGRLENKFGQHKIILEMTVRTKKDLITLKNFIEKGKMITIMDTYYPLKEIALAHRYVEKGMKKGNLIITIED